MNNNKRRWLEESIKMYMERMVPGLFYTLNLYCRKYAGKDCITIMLEEPWVLKDILSRMYGSSSTLKLIARTFLYPITLEDANTSLDTLVELFKNNPEELRKVIRNLLDK